MLEKEFQYYLDNQDFLVKQYEGKFIVIKDQQVTGAYDSQGEAYTESAKKFALGTFLIQLCAPGKEAYTQTFHSRVSFA